MVEGSLKMEINSDQIIGCLVDPRWVILFEKSPHGYETISNYDPTSIVPNLNEIRQRKRLEFTQQSVFNLFLLSGPGKICRTFCPISSAEINWCGTESGSLLYEGESNVLPSCTYRGKGRALGSELIKSDDHDSCN